MKGKKGRFAEQEETRNLATFCCTCLSDYGRENGLIDHMEKIHRKDGFICEDCKRGDIMQYKNRHGGGKCLKISSVKKMKASKKEKKLRKDLRPQGYVD